MTHSINREFSCGPLVLRQCAMARKGDDVGLHDHPFAHVALVNRGKVRALVLKPDGSILFKGDISAGQAQNWVNVPALHQHSFEALKDNTEVLCMFPHRTPDGAVSEEPTGWERGHA